MTGPRFGSFQELQGEVSRRREAGDHEGALELLTSGGLSFPDQLAHTYLARVQLLAETGRIDESLRVFAEALAAGCRYPLPVLRSRPFTPLHEVMEFERLEHIAAMRYDAELAASRPKLVVREPHAGSRGTLFVLHGNNSRADRTVPQWEHALERGWRLALAQSAEISFTPGVFVWNDARSAQEHLRHHLDALTGPVVSAGYSMGALRALELAASEPERVRGAIAVAPYFPADTPAALAPALLVPTVLIVGDRDEQGRPGSEGLAAALRGMGRQVLLKVLPDQGHSYPANMPQLLEEAFSLIG